LNRGGSLRLRLLLWGAGSIAIALLIVGIVILTSFNAAIEAERRDDLEASLDRLTAALDPDAVDLAGPAPLADPRYDTPLSGLYWQISDRDTGAVVRSRSLWDQELPLASPVAAGAAGELSEIEGPDRQKLVVLTRAVTVDGAAGERHFNVAVAEERGQDGDPISSFGINLVVALAVLGLVLLLAAGLQVHFGLRPLETLRREIAAIRHGERPRLREKAAIELEPVVQQINELLDGQEATIAFARDRAADLAHGLKTPLAVLSASAERLRESGAAADADLLSMLADQMNERIDYQLRIARLRVRTRARGASSSLNDVVLRSVAVLKRSDAGERLSWLVDLEQDLRADIDEHDLMELAGVVLENASQWATASVRINGVRRDDRVELVVEDDGRGVSDDQISRLGERGLRLDESSSGQGLGLAIAVEIVRLNHGLFAAGRSRLGGFRAAITLPAG
jgi:signal transduction histidine kinase